MNSTLVVGRFSDGNTDVTQQIGASRTIANPLRFNGGSRRFIHFSANFFSDRARRAG
jgi:hypothetical protein